MKILMTGATGFVGKNLGKELVRRGHQLTVITRNEKQAHLILPFPCQIITGDLNRESINNLPQVDAVIHLAGENVGSGRWSEEKKQAILNSRKNLSTNLLHSLKTQKNLHSFISASAIGFYGDTQNNLVNENSAVGQDFLSQVCHEWETQIQKNLSIRTVILRIGVVLNAFGGAFEKMKLPFELSIAGPLGSGKQWLSWIHLQDLVSMFVTAVENNNWNGTYNAVASEPVTNKTFTEKICRLLKQNMKPAVPSIALKTLLGEMAQIVLSSQKVSNEKILSQKSTLGFQFKYPDIDSALQDITQYMAAGESVFYTEQFLNLPRQTVFDFFAEAKNLEKITPEILNFKIEKMSTANIELGTLIDYKLKVHNVPTGWKTKIESWHPPKVFVDTQLKGPYRQWHHTHHFEELAGGTLMTDLVRYKLPMGILGKAVAGNFVKNDVEQIFSYRRTAVLKFLSK